MRATQETRLRNTALRHGFLVLKHKDPSGSREVTYTLVDTEWDLVVPWVSTIDELDYFFDERSGAPTDLEDLANWLTELRAIQRLRRQRRTTGDGGPPC